MKTNSGLRTRARVFSMPVVCGVFLLTLSGCGGGGGSSGGGSSLAARDALTSNTAVQTASPAVSAVAAMAAGNAPNEGSVTQSSNGDGDQSEPVTTDTVEVSATRTSSGYGFTVTKTDGDGAETWEVTQANGGQVQSYTGFAAFELAQRQGTSTSVTSDDGTLIVGFYTDIEAATITSSGDDPVTISDSDYLAGGVWLYVPDDAQQVADLEIGAFADGNDPFDKDNIDALTGTAKYEGPATGVYTADYATTAGGEVGIFDAGITLTADFGTNMIDGSLTDVVVASPVDGTYSLSGELALGDAPITTAADGGFFNGIIASGETLTDAFGSTFTTTSDGNWGGQFFGDGDGTATGYPGSVAGTFGATGNSGSSDGTPFSTTSFVGVFGAELDPTP